MRARHLLSETSGGLRRNLSLTLAVVVTLWVSLSLFGAGLLASQQVDLMKGRWYDKIEISVFLCTADTQGARCDPGRDTTPAQQDLVRRTLTDDPEVASGGVYFETKDEAFAAFQKAYRSSPIGDSLRPSQMQESFRVKLKDPEQYRSVVSSVAGLDGVQNVQDLRTYLDPLFSWLDLLQWGTIGASALLLLAAALQIGNTIRLAVFSRRREIEIMRLVGAGNLFITLPFLLEALVAAVAGVLLSCGTLAVAVRFLVIGRAQVSIRSLPWVGWHEAEIAMAGVAVVGVLLSLVPTLLTTRKYVRV